jgi:hypothetical protein
MPGQVTGDENLEDLQDLVAKLQKDVNWILNGNLSSKNVREIGGYNVSETLFQSRGGDVGMSSDPTGTDPVRFWAGSTNKDTAPWRVHKSGKSVMTGALIQSSNGTYPLIKMDPTSSLFGAYTDANKYISMVAMDGTRSVPALLFKDDSIPMYSIMYIDDPAQRFTILSAGDMFISAGTSTLTIGGFRVKTDWSTLYNYAETQTLQQALDAKASVTALSSKADVTYVNGFGINMGFDPGTRNLKLFAANGSTLATVNIP